jgi:hypothetical protein
MKNILKLIGPLIAVIFLFVLVGKLGFAKISDLRSDVSKETKNKTLLTEKLAFLNEVTAESDQASFTASALPAKNPSLITVSQLKTLAAGSGLFISGIKGGGQVLDNSGVSRVDINFDVDGPRELIIQFLTNIQTIAPISTVEKAKLVELGGAARASVTVRTFFATLPEKLPALTDAVDELTPDERQTLIDVLGLTQPSFVDVTPSQGGREDPFTP